jgi:hypothetical protein
MNMKQESEYSNQHLKKRVLRSVLLPELGSLICSVAGAGGRCTKDYGEVEVKSRCNFIVGKQQHATLQTVSLHDILDAGNFDAINLVI